MKRIVILCLALTALMANAQYQLPNPGFEQWDGGNTSEPTHWNSFATSDGSYASLASSPHHYRRNGGRPGTDGSHFLTIYTKSIMGIKANGNMTTGRIHAGAMIASSSENYNYTQRSNANHCQPFSGTPDSMYVWVSYYAANGNSKAQISAILHGDNDFRSPNQENDASLFCGKATTTFNRTTSSDNTYQWRKLKVPFVYNGNSAARYMLINMTTNATPGGGDSNDSLSIDDIEFVYSSWLTGITLGGQPIDNFQKGQLDYLLHIDDTSLLNNAEVEAVAEVDDATVAIDQQRVDDTTSIIFINVTAEDNVTRHTYTLTITSGVPSVGLPDVAEQSSLSVYPNPALSNITVTADGKVSIMSLDGRILLQSDVKGTAILDVSSLPAGLYLLRCGNSVRRLIKH